MRNELENMHRWARTKIDAGSEPPWAWYQYMKLVETCDAILMGMAATITTENSPQSELQSGGASPTSGLHLSARYRSIPSRWAIGTDAHVTHSLPTFL